MRRSIFYKFSFWIVLLSSLCLSERTFAKISVPLTEENLVVIQSSEDRSEVVVTYTLSKLGQRSNAFKNSTLRATVSGFLNLYSLSKPELTRAVFTVESQYMGNVQSTTSFENREFTEIDLLKRSRKIQVIISRTEAQSEYEELPTTDTISFFQKHTESWEKLELTPAELNVFIQLLTTQFWELTTGRSQNILTVYRGPLGGISEDFYEVFSRKIRTE